MRGERGLLSEVGQATTEYVLLLVTVVGLALIVNRTLIQPTVSRLGPFMAKKLEKALGGPNFHSFSIGRKR